MAVFTNYFSSAIYDGLQLAYKVTANSLYGQVNAPTSPIYMKELLSSCFNNTFFINLNQWFKLMKKVSLKLFIKILARRCSLHTDKKLLWYDTIADIGLGLA